MKQKLLIYFSATLLIFTMTVSFIPNASAQLSVVRNITFPVIGGGSYANDFGAPRSGGRSHEGNDIMGNKMQKMVSAVDGVISDITTSEASWGFAISVTDSDGYEYNYLHMNNDTPGTDDGDGGFKNAFAPGMKKGLRVKAGQHIGYVGDSGNAEDVGAQLHFEIRSASNNDPINPYESLKQAKIISQPIDSDDSDSEPPSNTTSKVTEFFPYDIFEGGANIASGNLDGDSNPEIVTGTAFGGGGRTIINIHDTNGDLKHKFFAYGEVFRGGVDVAVADVDGDGKQDIITAAGPGGGPHIKVFKPDGTLITEFFAYGTNFRGGVYVSAADMDGDGKAEIVTGPGAGGGPHVRMFNGNGVVQKELFAYDAGFTGGVDVAAFGVTNKQPGGFATAPGSSGGPHIKVFDASAKLTNEFMTYEGSFTNGVRISAGNLLRTNGAEIVTIPASNSNPTLKVFRTNGTLEETEIGGFESNAVGGYDAAIVGSDVYTASQSGRKTSVRKVLGL